MNVDGIFYCLGKKNCRKNIEMIAIQRGLEPKLSSNRLGARPGTTFFDILHALVWLLDKELSKKRGGDCLRLLEDYLL